jgi:opacity protein-like surface antigen
MEVRMKKLIVVAVLLIGLASVAYSTDTEFWQAVGVDFKPAKSFKLYLEKQLRYENKFTFTESDFYEVGLRYSFNKYLDFRVNYRFEYRPNDNEKRNRIDGNLYLTFKLPYFEISNRSRLQQEYLKDLDSSWSELEFRDRIRLTLRGSKKIKPYVGGEIFIGLGDGGKDRLKLRLTVGTDWNIKKRVTLSLFYHYQKFLEREKPVKTNVLGMKFNYSF